MHNPKADQPLQILHLEDSPLDAELIRECLQAADLSVQLDWVTNERDFTTSLQRGGYDLVLADYHLPQFDGAAALALAKALRPGVPFICVSGAIGEERAVELLKRGATDYVLKNRLSKLPLTLKRALDEAHERNVRRLTEEALVLALNAAEKANQAKSQFLATMSHELRTPLNPILGFVELLSDAPNLTDEQRAWLAIITQRGQDLLHLIGAVLDLAKIEADKIVLNQESFPLRQTVRDLIASILPAATKNGVALEWAVESEVPDHLRTDGFRLRQVLLNLLNNAIKFTAKGSIVLRVQAAQTAQLQRAPATGEIALRFSVHDTGIGIAPDRQSAIFESFTHADQQESIKYGGAGLGLAIAKRLVELMGGRIWVESTPGQGSTFSFTLLVGLSPVAPSPTSHATSATSSEVGGKPLNVLIVEDDPASLKMTTILVSHAGHTVQTARDGGEAVALTEWESFDLILMDIQLPNMDGVEATQLIRAREARSPSAPRTRIIALTAYAMKGDRERLLTLGVDGYLPKPVTAVSLLEALRTVN